MPKKDHAQEFLNALKEELKKPERPKNPREQRILERAKRVGRVMPPSMVIAQLARMGRVNRAEMEQETWISLARMVYDFWVEQNYPGEEPLP